MRQLLVLLAFVVSTAAGACPSDQFMTFIRDEDGAEFTPGRYGFRQDRWPVWSIYRGKIEGRTFYWATGDIVGPTGTSGTSSPTEGIRWSYDLGHHSPGEVIGTINEGPLQGVWRVQCQPRPLEP